METNTKPLPNDIQRSIDAQRRAEAKIEKMFGRGFQERILIIRQAIEDNPNIVELDYRQEDRLMGYLPTPTPEKITQFMHQLAEVADGMYAMITDSKSGSGRDRKDNILTLIGTAYCLGMLIHPFFDGNRRIFTTLALSYLHELLPETAGYVFRYKTNSMQIDADPFHDIIPDDIYKGIPVDISTFPQLVQDYLRETDTLDVNIGKLNILEGQLNQQGYDVYALLEYKSEFQHTQTEIFLRQTLLDLREGRKNKSMSRLINSFKTRLSEGSTLQPKQLSSQDINPFV